MGKHGKIVRLRNKGKKRKKLKNRFDLFLIVTGSLNDYWRTHRISYLLICLILKKLLKSIVIHRKSTILKNNII